jgi:hypothetical protein
LDKALDDLLDDPRVKERHKRALIRKWEREELTIEDINMVQSAVGAPLTEGAGHDDNDEEDNDDFEGDTSDPENEEDIDDDIKKGPAAKKAAKSATKPAKSSKPLPTATPVAPLLSKNARLAMQKDSLGKKPVAPTPAKTATPSTTASSSISSVETKMASLSISSAKPSQRNAAIVASKEPTNDDGDDEGDDDYDPEGDDNDDEENDGGEGDDEDDSKEVDDDEAGFVAGGDAGDDDELSWVQQKATPTPATATPANSVSSSSTTTNTSIPTIPFVLPTSAAPDGAAAVSAFVQLGGNSKKGEFTLGANKRAKPQSVRRV